MGARRSARRYYSVEFSFEGLCSLYQFKIWHMDLHSMYVLVKDGSPILGQLKVGETIPSRFYSPDADDPFECLDTLILHITRKEKGRFRGHHLVGLEIRERAREGHGSPSEMNGRLRKIP
jgi:hypothetical protein